MKVNFANTQSSWRKYRSLGLFLVLVIFTAGFDISCPPLESLEGIDTDINPIFHDGTGSDSYIPPRINAVAVDSRTGSFFVGGSFASIDNVTAVNIAFYDKTHDRFFRLFGKGVKHEQEFMGSSVNALTISGSYLYVGGSFSQTATAVPTTGLNNIARYYIGNGSLRDVENGYFEQVSNSGLNGPINALEVLGNDLFVGGMFSNTFSGSVSGLNNLGRYAINCASNCWSSVYNGGMNSTVNALEKGKFFSDDVLFIGGEFSAFFPSNSAVRFAAYLPGTNTQLPLPGFNGSVKALAYSNGRIYAGGGFTQNADNNVSLSRIAYYEMGSMGNFQPLGNGLNGEVKALAILEDFVFAGGFFTQSGSQVLNNIALIDPFHPFGVSYLPLSSNGLNDSVNALGIDAGQFLNNVIAAGNFTRNGDNTGEDLKRVVSYVIGALGGRPDRPASGTGPNPTLKPLGLPAGSTVNGPVNATAADPNGKVIVGGTFTKTADGATNLNRIARYDPATQIWSPLANGGLNNNVEAMIVVGENLYVGGSFSATADGTVTNLNRIARYNLTTNTWSPVGNNGLFASFSFAPVSAFAVKDNILYVGGEFSRTFDNTVTNLNNLAAYNLTTNTWSPFANFGTNASVNALAIVGDDLYIAGSFTRSFDNDYFLLRFTRFNLMTETWFEVANSGLNSDARRMIVAGNYIFVNGYFSRTWDNTIILDQLGRYDTVSNSWTRMSGDTQSRNAAIQTYSMTQIGNEMFVGGNFSGNGNGVAHFFAQFHLQKWNVPAPTSDWFDSSNWKLGSVPANNSNASIPPGAGNINIASADVVLNDFNFSGGNLNIDAGRTLTINGILNLNGGTISGSGTLVIANCRPDGIIGGDSNTYVQSTLVRCVNNSGTFNFPVGTASGHSPVTIKNVTGTGNVSVKPNQGAYSGPATGLPANRLARWWTIENPGGGVTNSDIYFNYLQGDIAGNEYGYRAYRVSGGTATVVSGSVNAFSNVATAPNVTGFSDWTLAEFAPSAATVAVAGRVLSANGNGINKAIVTLTDQGGGVRRLITNSFGYYRFDGVETGRTYVLTAGSKRYAFVNPTLVISPNDDATDIDFVAVDPTDAGPSSYPDRSNFRLQK